MCVEVSDYVALCGLCIKKISCKTAYYSGLEVCVKEALPIFQIRLQRRMSETDGVRHKKVVLNSQGHFRACVQDPSDSPQRVAKQGWKVMTLCKPAKKKRSGRNT